MTAAFGEVTYRGAAAMCGCDPKTIRRALSRWEEPAPARKARAHNYDAVRALVAKRVSSTKARISAKRLLPEPRAAGYAGFRFVRFAAG